MKTPRVFISMGTPYKPEYSQFRDELERLLRDRCGVDPRIIGKNEYPSGSPLNKIREVMSSCDGAIIVAYERKFIETGLERRGSAHERTISGEAYTTTWNHVESAIAFSLHLPLYIFCERGLTEDGLIESKIDWFVQRFDFTPEALSAPNMVDSLRAWVDDRVVPHSKRPADTPSRATRLKLSGMSVEQWAGLLAIFAFLVGVGIGVSRLPELFRLANIR
jgi:hypothetical protein